MACTRYHAVRGEVKQKNVAIPVTRDCIPDTLPDLGFGVALFSGGQGGDGYVKRGVRGIVLEARELLDALPKRGQFGGVTEGSVMPAR